MTRLQDYFIEQVNIFNECHSSLLKETTKEDIHKLRTTIKRLKTFNILLDGLLFRQKDFPNGLSNLFKMLGGIRDIQIQQKILDDYDENFYTKYLSYSYDHQISKFTIKDSFKDELQYLNDKLDKVEDYHIDEQIIANIKTMIDLGYDDIREMVSIVSTGILHEIRTKFKRIYYNLLMLGESEDIDKLYNIQESIGLWHDYDVTIKDMKNFDKYLTSDVIKLLAKKRDSLYNESLELIKSL